LVITMNRHRWSWSLSNWYINQKISEPLSFSACLL